MMNAWLRKVGFGLVIAIVWSAAFAANPITAAELQRLLQAAPRPTVAFQEVRESPWLAAPVTSRGTMRSTPQSLEKHVESPREETWRLLPDRVEWVGPGGGAPKQITFSQAPALAALSEVMRRVVAGDIVALQRDFRIELSGDKAVWRAHLQPRAADVARYLESVELQGAAGRLQVIIVVERQGERTTTRLLP
jgi:hypothetical protein